jgi:hypothetical protein
MVLFGVVCGRNEGQVNSLVLSPDNFRSCAAWRGEATPQVSREIEFKLRPAYNAQ